MALYGQGLLGIIDGTIDLVNDTIKAILVDDTYVFDADHDFANDVSADELSGTGYTGGFAGAGRKTLAGKALTNDTVNNRVEFTFTAPVWTALNAGTIGGVVLVKEVTDDTASRIIGFLDPTNLVTNGGDVTLTPDAQGAIQFTY